MRESRGQSSGIYTVFEFLPEYPKHACARLVTFCYINGSFVYEVCRLSSKESNESAKAEQSESQTSMSPFVMFCVDFGHFYSRHFHHKKAKSHVALHFLALSVSLTFPTLSIERWLVQLWLV